MVTMSLQEKDTKTRKTAHMPYIMPDGRRTLGTLLVETEQLLQRRRPQRHHTRRRRKVPTSGWTSSAGAGRYTVSLHSAGNESYATSEQYMPREQYMLTGPGAAEQQQGILPGGYSNGDNDKNEALACMSKLGNRKQRRWMNEYILREMSPQLTAEGIDSLFKPAPFGEQRPPSVFVEINTEEYATLWNLFRVVDSDKQNRVLEKWEAYVEEFRQEANLNREKRHGHESCDEDDKDYEEHRQRRQHQKIEFLRRKRWSTITAGGKVALRKASSEFLRDIEQEIMDACIVQKRELAEFDAYDSFGRLLIHSVATFHGFKSRTTRAEGRAENAKKVVEVFLPSASKEIDVSGSYMSIVDYMSSAL